MVQGIQKGDKQQQFSSAVKKSPPPILVHHHSDGGIPMYPVATVMTELQFPPSPYHLTTNHSPMMQQPSHSPMMQQPSHSPMMQHSPVDHQNHSPTVQPSAPASFLSVASPYSNPASPMAYSPANVQFSQGGVACHIYPRLPQETIPSRPPPEYPSNSYYGMTVATTYPHDQM